MDREQHRMQLWRDVYLEALRGGGSSRTIALEADDAMKAFDAEFPSKEDLIIEESNALLESRRKFREQLAAEGGDGDEFSRP